MPVIFIDESGVLNNPNIQRYFVLSALVTEQPKHRKRLKRLCRRLYRKHCIPKGLDEIHANKLGYLAKQDVLKKLSALECFHIDYLVADKQHIIPRLFERKNLCYNYLVSRLVKKLIKKYDEPVEILLDNHTIKAGGLHSLHDYIAIQASTKWEFQHDIRLRLVDSKIVHGIQLVDVVSNSIFAKYNYGKNHLYQFNESNYRHRIRFPYQKFGH